MIYLDYAATTPMSEEALAVYVQAAQRCYGNEQSLHDIGSDAASLLAACRRSLAELIGGEADGIYFTSSGTEANILALHSLIAAHEGKGRHIITTTIEHASVRSYMQQLEQHGYDITYLPVRSNGRICLSALEAAIREDTLLISIQHANSELGTIQPISHIGKLAAKYGILFQTDCVQTFGKVPIQAAEMGIDSLSLSAHKLYGPKGVGACYISPRSRWKPLLPGTSHERGFRPGTVNVPGIASFTAAAQALVQKQKAEQERMWQLRRLLLQLLRTEVPGAVVYGDEVHVLPHIVGLTLKGAEGQYTMLECNRRGIAISVGSACQIGKQEPSPAMLAIGAAAEAKQYIRLSFGLHTTEAHIYKAAQALAAVAHQLLKELPAYDR